MSDKELQQEIDESVIRYGSREFIKNNENINRLLTTHSETEYGERQDRGERGQLRREFNDRNFLRPAEKIIPQPNQSTKDFQAKLKEFNTKNKNNAQTKEKELKQ